MVNPCPGYRITTPYHRTGSLWKTCGWHTGVDFQAPKGTPIVAAISGTIRHRNYGVTSFGPFQFAISPSVGQAFADDEVFYAHCLDRLPDGTEVKAGQVVSHVGDLGNATGYHLHFEYHKGKNVWNCTVMRDPKPVLDWQAPTVPVTPPAAGPYVTKDIYSNKLGYGEPTNGDTSSDTVKELQEVLNRTKLTGGQSLPVTGKYWTETDEEVRLWQAQVVHDTPDPVNKSYLGPAQRAKMFPSPTYTIHDVGLPAVAAGGGSGGSVPVDPAPPTGAPPAPAVIYPTAHWEPIKKPSGEYFTGLRPFTGNARKITLHTTETTTVPNWTALQSGIPHFTADLDSDLVWQHLPLDMAAYTMKGGERSPNSDSGFNIQIEIVGYARASKVWTDVSYTRLVRLIEWISTTCHVQWSFPCVFGDNGQFSRLSWEAWYGLNGILGHQHAPYNDHWDPGQIDVVRMNTIYELGNTPPPVVEPPVVVEPPITEPPVVVEPEPPVVEPPVVEPPVVKPPVVKPPPSEDQTKIIGELLEWLTKNPGNTAGVIAIAVVVLALLLLWF